MAWSRPPAVLAMTNAESVSAYLQHCDGDLGKRVVSMASGAAQTVQCGGVGRYRVSTVFSSVAPGDPGGAGRFHRRGRGDDPYHDNHAALLAHLLAQAEALANGQDASDPHRAYQGNRPGTVWLLDALTPQTLGMLLALYEHSVYLQSVLWGVNAFDQFGVELGKQVAGRLLPAVQGDAEADDAVTRAILAQIKSRQIL